jgi:hypothetical protein
MTMPVRRNTTSARNDLGSRRKEMKQVPTVEITEPGHGYQRWECRKQRQHLDRRGFNGYPTVNRAWG